MALELGKPLQIDDDDCEVGEPMPVSDDCIQSNGVVMAPPSPQQAVNGLIAVIPVVRITASIKKTLKSRTIASATLNTYDEHFKAIMASYPDPFPIHSTTELDPRLLTAACGLQTSRLLLYRHNLSPTCRHPERREALDRMVSVAKDTAHYVSRSCNPHHMASWGARLRTMAPAFFCAHIWRCMLVLIFRGEYASALTLLNVCAAVGDLRKNNTACGRHLTFFLDKLIDRLRAGASQQTLEADEEMLAYVSGDMQGTPDSAWTWTGSEPAGSTLSMPAPNGYANTDPMLMKQEASPPGATNHLTDREIHEWPGWEHIQRVLSQLLHESQQQQYAQPLPPPAQPHGYPQHAPAPYPPQHQQPPAPQMQQQTPQQHHSHLAPQQLPPLGSVSPAHSNNSGNGSGNSGSSRISIKDIM